MKTTIYCKPTGKGVHSFFMHVGAQEFFLFSQAYRKCVAEYFGKGVYLSEAMKHSRAHFDTAISRTMDKLPAYIKYIEREYDIEVLTRTKKRNNSCFKARCA